MSWGRLRASGTRAYRGSELIPWIKIRVRQWESKRKLWDSQALVECRQTEGYTLNVMTVGNEVVGYLAYFPAKKLIVIDELGVSPIHWRNGYATYMIRRLQRIVAVTEHEPFGFKGIGVKVAEKNLAAQLLFRRCGFKWVKTICHDLPGHDTYAMQCKNQVFGGCPVT